MSTTRSFLVAGLGSVAVFGLLLPSACERHLAMPHEARSGGTATVFDTTRDAFSQPVPGLEGQRQTEFFVGNSFFNSNWVSAPASVADRDGLGPLFNARSCSSCHFKDGRGRPPEANQPLSSMLLRVGLPGQGLHGEALGHPVYGDQIQGSALPGLPAEAQVFVDYALSVGAFADAERYELRQPQYRLEQPGYGEFGADLLVSARVAPAMVGLGLLQAVPEALLVSLADPGDEDSDGISGRLNEVLDIATGAIVAGRFGWKAEQPSVLQQTAAAFSGDMGLSTHLFMADNHSTEQTACGAAPSGGSPEVSDEILNAVDSYARSLAVPARRDVDNPIVSQGEELFAVAGCSSCHVPTLETASADSGEVIHPYTDLLIHDMGEGLSDSRPSFVAMGPEWRTPPLWGVGLVSKVNEHTFLLHDGRARNLSEAILWHGGEAGLARSRFVEFSSAERGALLAFLASL
jgi:CxxC motif-containing protein (DUF1111 family)